MEWGVYLLACLSGPGVRTYIGATPDLRARVRTHNRGRGAKLTRGGGWTPVIHVTGFSDKRSALSFESGWRRAGRRRRSDRLRVWEQVVGERIRYRREPIHDRLVDLLWFTRTARRWDAGWRCGRDLYPLWLSEALGLRLSLQSPQAWAIYRDWPWPPGIGVLADEEGSPPALD